MSAIDLQEGRKRTLPASSLETICCREVCILLPEQTDLLGLLSFRVKNFMAT